MIEVQLKATSANAFVAFLASEFDPPQIKKLLAGLRPDEARLLTGSLPATERVPFSAMNRLTVLAARQKNEPLKDFGRRAGRFIADYATQRVYKYVLVLLSPPRILKAAPLAWSRIFDRGVLTVDVGRGRARISIRDFAPDVAGCARITGWFEFVGSRSARDMRVVHASRGGRGPALRLGLHLDGMSPDGNT
jgi:hypothetical protein